MGDCGGRWLYGGAEFVYVDWSAKCANDLVGFYDPAVRGMSHENEAIILALRFEQHSYQVLFRLAEYISACRGPLLWEKARVVVVGQQVEPR